MNDVRSVESWRIVSVCADVAEDDLLVGDEARAAARSGSATSPVHQLGGARGGARRRVELAVVVQLDDLGLGHVPRRPRRRSASSAPRRSRSSARRRRCPAPRRRAQRRRGRSPSSRSRRARRPRGTRSALSSAVSGRVKSTTTSASPSTSASGVSERRVGAARRAPGRRRASTASQTVWPMRPAAPATATRIDARAAASASAGHDRLQRAAERVLVGADAGRAQRARARSSSRGQRAHVVERDGVDALDHLVDASSSGRSASTRARRGGSSARSSTPAPARRGP